MKTASGKSGRYRVKEEFARRTQQQQKVFANTPFLHVQLVILDARPGADAAEVGDVAAGTQERKAVVVLIVVNSTAETTEMKQQWTRQPKNQ